MRQTISEGADIGISETTEQQRPTFQLMLYPRLVPDTELYRVRLCEIGLSLQKVKFCPDYFQYSLQSYHKMVSYMITVAIRKFKEYCQKWCRDTAQSAAPDSLSLSSASSLSASSFRAQEALPPKGLYGLPVIVSIPDMTRTTPTISIANPRSPMKNRLADPDTISPNPISIPAIPDLLASPFIRAA